MARQAHAREQGPGARRRGDRGADRAARQGRRPRGVATLRLALLTVAAIGCATTTAFAAPDPLDAELDGIARASGFHVGVAVEEVEKKAVLAGHEAARPFPLASTFKLPLAVAVMRAIERGELPKLDGKVRLEPWDMRSWASDLHDRAPTGGDFSLRELVAATLEHSDNSAADGLLRLVGGPARLTAALVALGVAGVSIDRDEAEMMLDNRGLAHPPVGERTAARLDALGNAVPVEKRRAAMQQFLRDPRDHATPAAMAHLLARLWRGELAAPASTRFLEDELARCQTGARRIRAGLPAGTPVADRTGTCYGAGEDDTPCANAVAVITRSDGTHLALAVYVESTGAAMAVEEHVIASVARAVWRRFGR